MKKVILTAAAVFAFGFANAQEAKEVNNSTFGFAKGDVIVEGNVGFSSNKETDSFEGTDIEENKSSSVNFNPKVGYFFTDKVVLGVELNLGSSTNENTEFGTPNVVTENKGNSFGAGVFARYYFLEMGERFKTYTEAGLGFGSAKFETNGEETAKNNSFNFGIGLGLNYFVTSNFAINFGLTDILGFGSSKTEFNGGAESKSNSFNGNLNVFNNFFDTAQFGLTYKF